jgi:diketogulonate reductase-like aldo/keto reductase
VLDTPFVDLLLIHFPPILGCIPANCAHMQQQWAALEQACVDQSVLSRTARADRPCQSVLRYAKGAARAIGVSNYCEACVQCLLKTAKIAPMVNQVQYHIGMGAGYPESSPGFWKRQNITIMAYSPLGGGKVCVSLPH